MTRQAAPPAHRWLLWFVVLVSASWLGQGVAVAATIEFDPPSGRPGSTVNVTLTDFLDACIVIFDDEVVAIGQGCSQTTLSFTVPESATVGEHQVRAVGQTGEDSVEEVATFEVTGDAAASPSSTVPAGTAPAATETTRAQNAGPPATGPPATGAPALPAASCPPGQVALMRFDLQPPRGDAGASVSAATTWGSVGACSEVRPLLVLFDGTPVAGQPPVAGTPGSFRITIPDGARPGRHRVTLVAADDESVELSSLTFDVVEGDASTLPLIVGAAAGGALLLLLVLLLVRRRRRRRRRDEDPPPIGAWATEGQDLRAGSVDVPDIAGAVADTRPGSTHVLAVEDDPTMPVVPLVVASGRNGSYYLLERQNANAPRTGNGKRGWYRTQRSSPIRGIVVRAVEPHTAGAAASELATGTTPASAHVVVDVSGALDLLPDDIVAQHDPRLDDAALVMLLAGFGADAATDEAILSHAVAWSAAKMRTHGIPARRVSPEEFRAGGSGILSDDAEFPWHRMRTLVEPPAGMVDLPALLDLPPAQALPDQAEAAAPAPVPDDPAGEPPSPAPIEEPSFAPSMPDTSVAPASVAGVPFPEVAAPSPPPPDESDGRPAADATAAIPTPVDVTETPTPAEAPLPTPAGVPETTESAPPDPDYRFASPPPGLLDAPPVRPLPPLPPLPTPPPPPPDIAAAPPIAPPEPTPVPVPRPPAPPSVRPPLPTPPVAPRRPREPGERQPLPTPDELIARTSGDTEYYLLEYENHHATLRANGKHGWYYPTRYGGIRAVVLHSIGGDSDTAEGVAAHLASVDQPEAAHAAIDPDTIIDLLPDETTALHGVRSSSAALDLAVVYDPTAWGTDPAVEEALLVRAAAWAGVRAVRHRIPVRRITVDDWHGGQRGFVARGDVDPGADFPWHRFLQLTTWVARRYAASQPPPPAPTDTPGVAATDPSETVRSGNPPT